MATVYIVGAGPGDPDLLTIKAARVLAEADLVLHDRLSGTRVLALAPATARLIDVGKHEGEQEAIQRRIERLMLDAARRGLRVVRLKGGDPMVFGRGAEEWRFLHEHGIEVEIVPGISSPVAVPELAGIPVTYRGVATNFAVVTGHCKNGCNDDWQRYAPIDTLVVLMGVKHRAAIAGALIEAGRDAAHPAAFIENGSTEKQRVIVTTLGEIARGEVEVEAPAVLVVGEVVRLREALVGATPRKHSTCAA